MIVENLQIPEKSQLFHQKSDYFDVFQSPVGDLDNQIDGPQLARLFFNAVPPWTSVLFKLRNRIVGIFGLKTGNGEVSKEHIIQNFKGLKGEKLGFFEVYYSDVNEIILGENDRHLDFRTSLFLDRTNEENSLFISTTVAFHNFFGKFYFLIVKPFHKIIVRSMMKRMVSEANK